MTLQNFKLQLESELRRLNLTKREVFEHLEMTRPTFDSRIKNPNTFSVGEIKKLNQLKLNLNY
jgi:hypothetical protein